MTRKGRASSITFPDVLFFVLILALATGLLLYPIHAVISDFWYHLATARAFITQHSIPLHDWWDFQPLGRPHFYPPLIHLILALVAQTTEGLMIISPSVGSMLYTACLISAWYFYRHFWGPGVALIATALITINLIFTLAATSLMPAALISLMLPLFLVALHRKQQWFAVFLLTASFYAHLSMPWFMVLGVLALMYKKERAEQIVYTKIIGWSLFFASPWLIHVLFSVVSLNLHDVLSTQNPLPGVGPFAFLSHYSVNILFFLLAVFGIWKLRKLSSPGLTLTRTFCIAFLPILLFYGGRYWWHLIPLFAVFAAVPFKKYVDTLLDSFTWQKAFGIIAVSALLIVPTIEFSFNAKETNTLSFDPEWTAFDMVLIPTRNATDGTDFKALAQFITTHTNNDAILSVDNAVVAEMLFVSTGRRTNNGQFWETSGTLPGSIPAQPPGTQYAAYVSDRGKLLKNKNLDIVQSFGEYSVAIVK